jgi:hypothetical protein
MGSMGRENVFEVIFIHLPEADICLRFKYEEELGERVRGV